MSQLQTYSFDNDSMTYLAPSWDEINYCAFDVSQKIKQKKLTIDRVVTLAKGGWPMTRSMVDFLGVKHVASIGIEFYSGLNQRQPKPEVYQDLPVSIQGENILLFDDVADTGGSLIFTLDYLKQKGARSVQTACLYYKPHSELKPDFYSQETSAWIIFPCEQFEMMKVMSQKWQKENNLKKAEIVKRFQTMGFADEFIREALKP